MKKFNFEIAEQFRIKENLVDVLGFILYTEIDSNIVKVLNDDDYWNGFDYASGEKWAIFSIRAQKGHTRMPDVRFKPGVRYRIVPIWEEPKENKNIMKEFELSDTRNFPILLLVSKRNDEMLKTHIQLDDTTQDSARNSIKKAIEIVTTAIDKVDEDESDFVFEAVKRGVGRHKTWTIFKKGVQYAAWVKGLI